MSPDARRLADTSDAAPLTRSFGRALGWFRWSAWVAVFLAVVSVLAVVCGLPASVTNDPWDRAMGSVAFAMSVPLVAWLGLLAAGPARRELDSLDPLVIGCVPFTGFLWFYMFVRMAETGVIPGL